jgi:septum formation protein
MPINEKKIFLCSRSLRRRELLHQIGVGHELLLLREDAKRAADVDETPNEGEAPHAYALRVASAKASAGLYAMSRRGGVFKPVLAADTTISLDETILGKPRDAEHAVRMLAALSGRSHTVITAVAMAYAERFEIRVSTSVVTLHALDEAKIRRYVATGEPMDKAGAYAVQGRAAAFIARIEGSYSGIMGLPLAETAELLALFGIETP